MKTATSTLQGNALVCYIFSMSVEFLIFINNITQIQTVKQRCNYYTLMNLFCKSSKSNFFLFCFNKFIILNLYFYLYLDFSFVHHRTLPWTYIKRSQNWFLLLNRHECRLPWKLSTILRKIKKKIDSCESMKIIRKIV